MTPQTSSNFGKWVARVCVVITVVHIIAFVFYTLFPTASLGVERLRSFYVRRVLVGPFFVADRIQVTHHVLISYKEDHGTWSPFINESKKNLDIFHESMWRYDKLKQSACIRYFCRGIVNSKRDSATFQRKLSVLDNYVRAYIAPDISIDSVKILYIMDKYEPETPQPKIDTIWTFKYAPHAIRD